MNNLFPQAGMQRAAQALLLIAMAAAGSRLSAQSQPIAPGYPVISAYPVVSATAPYAPGQNRIAQGPDGNVWFTYPNPSGGGYIGEMTPGGQLLNVFPISGAPMLITRGMPADYFSIWFVEAVGNGEGPLIWELGRISTVQTYSSLPTGCPGNVAPCVTLDGAPIPYQTLPQGIEPNPNAIISSPSSPGNAVDLGIAVTDTGASQDNGIYIADTNNAVLWRANIASGVINPTLASQIVWQAIPTAGNTYGVTWGPDNYLWCTEYLPTEEGPVGYLERIPFPSAVISPPYTQIARTTFNLPIPNTPPTTFDAMTPGPDGLSVWFSQNNGQIIDSILTNSSAASYSIVAQYPLFANNSTTLNDMTLGPDFALWFTQTETSASSLGRLSVSAAGMVTYTAPALNNGSFSQPYGIAVGPNNNDIWFTDELAAFLGDVTIIPRLTILNGSTLPNGVVGAAYPVTPLQASGGTGAYTWSLSSSAPAWLGVDPTTNSLVGTVAAPPETYPPFGGTVSDSNNTPSFPNFVQVATQQFNLTTTAVLTVTPMALPSAVAGTAYPATQLAVTGGAGTYTWSLANGTSLPAGLTLSAGGVISGPLSAAAKSATFFATVTDTETPPQTSAAQSFTITVVPPLAITTAATLPGGAIGTRYSVQLQAQGGAGAYTWSLAAGSSLPTTLTLSPAGLIAGTLTGLSGTTQFKVLLNDPGPPPQRASRQFSITTTAGTPAAITATSGGGQSTQVNKVFTNPLVATVKDASGNLVSAATVTFSAPASGASGTFAGGGITAIVKTNASGVATSPAFTANAIAGGPYTVAAMVTGAASPASFALTNTAPPPTFTPLTGLPSSPTPGAPISSATVTSSAPFQGTLTVSLSPTDAGFPSGSNGDAGFGTGFGSKLKSIPISVPEGTNVTVDFPALTPLDPGTVAGSLTVSLTDQAQTSTQTSTVTIEPLAPIIEANSVQFTSVTSSGFDVELVATSTTLDLKTATFTFTAAAGAQISGTSTFPVDVSSLLPKWFAIAGNYQYGGAFALTIPFTISGPASAIQSVSVTLTNSIGTSSPVSGIQ